MATGGWVHPHVKDSFGKLTTTDQIRRYKIGSAANNKIRKHIVIKDATVGISFFLIAPASTFLFACILMIFF
jgi:hypothetical protein